MDKRRSLGLNAVLNGLRNVLNLLFPLITFPYVTRVLSVSEIGVINFSSTYVNYFMLIAGLGIGTYAVREGAKYRDQRNKIAEFSSQIFSINLIATIAAYLLLFVSLFLFKNLRNYFSCILIFSLQILFTTLGTEWIYTIYEDYAYITLRSIGFKILSIVLLFVLVKSPADYLLYAGITVFAAVGSNLLNFIHARKYIQIQVTRQINWRHHLQPILIIFASAIAVTIYIGADMTILGLLKDDYAVGIYSISVKIYQLAQSVFSAILVVAIPRLAMLWGKKRREEYHHVLLRVINSLMLLILPALFGLVMLSREVILIIAGEKYLPAVSSLQLITWAIAGGIFSWIYSDCILIPAGREVCVLRNTVITAVVNIVLNVIFIPFMSYNGSALSTVISYVLVTALNFWDARDIAGPIMRSRIVIRNLIDSLIGCAGVVLMCIICGAIWHDLVWKTISSVILSVIGYGVILVLLQNELVIEFLHSIRQRIKH